MIEIATKVVVFIASFLGIINVSLDIHTKIKAKAKARKKLRKRLQNKKSASVKNASTDNHLSVGKVDSQFPTEIL